MEDNTQEESTQEIVQSEVQGDAQEQPVVEDVEELAGVPEGEVLTTTDTKGNEVEEKVVTDYDEDGNIVGWHKEVV